VLGLFATGGKIYDFPTVLYLPQSYSSVPPRLGQILSPSPPVWRGGGVSRSRRRRGRRRFFAASILKMPSKQKPLLHGPKSKM
jgi:hypothetical protein